MPFELVKSELEAIVKKIFLDSSQECPITTRVLLEPFIGDDGPLWFKSIHCNTFNNIE